MKIAIVAPLGERVPPKKYGGTERFIYTLTQGLVKSGHDVTLFASGDSETSARLISSHPKSLREAKIKNPYQAGSIPMLNIGKAYSMQDKFDVIHDNNGYLSLPTATLATTPVVMTLHGAFHPDGKKLYEELNNFNNPYFVSISYSQRKPAPALNWIGNVYHGIEVTDYPFSSEHDGYLLYVGRITEEKGVHHAIDVAQFLDLPLVIAAKLDPCDMPYFKEFVEPRLTDKIKWIGEVDAASRNRLMSRALCFIHPVMWREPFGLTLIESMACGTPVVAFGRGSIAEIVKHGKNGFIAEDTSEMIEYVKNIESIKRKNCRTYVEQNFSATKMIQDYEAIYKKVIGMRSPEMVKTKTLPPSLVQN